MRRLYITLTWNSQILSFLRTWTARRQAQTSSPLLRSNQISYRLYWMRLSVPWRSRGIQYNQGVKREGVEASGVEHMVGHLFQNYDTIYVRYFPTYTCNHSCYTIYVRFFATYTCVLSYKRAYICAQKSPYICVTNKHVVYGVTESGRIKGTELYRQQKTPSCTMELKSNFSLNQARPQWPR